MRPGHAVPGAVPCPKLWDESGRQQGCAESASAVNKQAQKATGKQLRWEEEPGQDQGWGWGSQGVHRRRWRPEQHFPLTLPYCCLAKVG